MKDVEIKAETEADEEQDPIPLSERTISPPAEVADIPSLQLLCQRQLATTVNMKNIIAALTFAEKFGSLWLYEYCIEFISRYPYHMVCLLIYSFN